MLDPATRVAPNREEVSGKVLDGEAIIINVSTGKYYSMDGVGALAWSLLESGPTVSEIAQAIAASHAVPAATALDDVSRLVGQLLEEGLVVVGGDARGAGGSDAAAPAAPSGAPYARPVLNVYTDMADLLALDPPMPMLADIPKGSSTDGA
jgi:hypothetical protein